MDHKKEILRILRTINNYLSSSKFADGTGRFKTRDIARFAMVPQSEVWKGIKTLEKIGVVKLEHDHDPGDLYWSLTDGFKKIAE